MDHKDLCEHTRIRLIAAAVGHQQCTKTASNIIPIPGGDRVIAIGTPAQVRALLADAAATAAQPLDAEHAELLTKQVASWRKEITRLQDLIEHATGSTGAAQPLELDRLEALARAATPGPWMRLFGERTIYDRMEDGCRGNAIVRADVGYGASDANNLDFIAAANPATILALIAQARAAQPESATGTTGASGRDAMPHGEHAKFVAWVDSMHEAASPHLTAWNGWEARAQLAQASAQPDRGAALTKEQIDDIIQAVKTSMNFGSGFFFPRGWNVLLDKLNAMIAAPSAVAPSDAKGKADAANAGVECLQEVVSHYGDFHMACTVTRDLQRRVGDRDSASYWDKQLHVLARMKVQAEAALSQSRAADAKDAALLKINDIRNSIIGLQSLNWSEHVYPLVAALDAAGYEGMGYPEARKYYGTLLERAVKAEDTLAAMAAAPSSEKGCDK